MTPTSMVAKSSILKDGLNAGWPICLGYLPIGMAFGVLAQKAGLTPLQIGLMSIMVFAGSAQFIAISMLVCLAEIKKGDQMKKIASIAEKDRLVELTVGNYQDLVDEWIKTLGVRYFSELTNLGILMEEVGELARIMTRTYGDQCFKPGEGSSDLADELADVLFVVCCLANQTGVNLTSALKKNLEKKTRRDKDRQRNNPKL
jgi:NTP pyrophosphatase (non-canonical NTP hydrolase)